MSSLFAWQVMDEGEWGTIATIVNGVVTPLVTRKEEVARQFFQIYAESHGQASQHPVRLARFDFAEELVRL